MSSLPLLPVTTVGSWPRPPELLRAQRLKQTGRLSPEAFERQADVAVLEVLHLQEDAGVDIVTDGEQRRDNFYSFVAEKLAGVQLMTLLEMLDIVEDRVGMLFTLARLLCWDVNSITPGVRLYAQRAQIDTHMYIRKPV